ncbi:MAG TPA: methyltransferase domain-containing protein [Thermoanaerobaculia bacterium]|nr:methyltransferase domain-containing protein [Thermoanaerobaculia bacterium]
MRVTLLKLLAELARSVDLPEPIYEFGAFRVEGQKHLPHVRDYFPGKRFVGCDMRAGDGVDEIQDLHALDIPDASVGTAILFDTIEHVREPWRATAEILRCLKPGGIVLMTSVWYFPIHAYPDDYWRFTASAFDALLQDFHPIATEMCGLEKLPHTVVGLASKGPIDPAAEAQIRRLVAAWKRHGASSWKEAVLDWLPPALLIPAYGLFLRATARLAPKRRSARDPG